MVASDFSAAAAALESRRLALEGDLLAAIFGDPIRGMTRAEREGVSVATFAGDDSALVWLGLLAARHHGELTGGGWIGGARRADQVMAARYVRAALQWGERWDDDPLRVGMWSRRRVWRELVLRYPDCGDVPRFCRLIRAIDRRQREAAAALTRAQELLTWGGVEEREAGRRRVTFALGREVAA